MSDMNVLSVGVWRLFCVMEKTHFWYSRRFANQCANSYSDRIPNIAIINGKRFHYNIANRKDQHGTNWSDAVYLGYGCWTRFLPSDQFAVDIAREIRFIPTQERTEYYEPRRLEIQQARGEGSR